MIQEKEIYGRIDRFVLSVLVFTKKLPSDLINREIAKQVIRSGSSVGANAREAQTSQTKKEFTRCFSISKRECKESWYWLTLLSKLNPGLSLGINLLIKEAGELTAIISQIILTSNKNSTK